MSFLVLLFTLIVLIELTSLIILFVVWRKLHRWHVCLNNAHANFHSYVREGKSRLKLLKQILQYLMMALPMLFPIRWEWQVATWVFKALTKAPKKQTH